MATNGNSERRKMNEGLVSDIKEIKAILVEMQKAESARVEREKEAEKDVTKLKEAVNGNGKPGLKLDVQLLKEQMGRVNWVGAIFAGAVLLDIITRLLKK